VGASPRVRSTVAAAAFVLFLAGAVVQAGEDMAGARDPAGIPRYPRSWIVEYALVQDGAPREFIVNRVDRIRRDLRVDDLRRVNADLEAATYQIASGTRLEDIVAHYRSSIDGEILFSCTGRDCGRSNDWANQVFHQAILYGPDSNQRYFALQRDDQLLALYVIERGNKRVYAHLQVLSVVDGDSTSSVGMLRRLADQGWAPIPDLMPLPDGQLPENAVGLLGSIAGELQSLAGKTLYVVCHMSGADPAATLLSASQRCADQAASLLNTQLATTGPELRGFGAGSLVPRQATPGSRLEIVDPSNRSPQ
jgi:hypothetical protein